MGRDREPLTDLDDVLPVDRVRDRLADLEVVEGRLRDLRQQIPGARIREPEDFLRGPRVGLEPLQVRGLQTRQVDLVVLIREHARRDRDDRSGHLLERDVLGAEEVLVLLQDDGLVVLPRVQHEGPVADDVRGLRPLVAVFLDRATVTRQRGLIGRQDREVAARPFERHLERPVVLRPNADLARVGHLLLVECLAVLDVVEEGCVGRRGRGIELPLERVLEIARRAR